MQGRLPAAIAHARNEEYGHWAAAVPAIAPADGKCTAVLPRRHERALVRIAGKRLNSLPMVVHNVPLLVDGCASVEHGLQAVHHGARSIGALNEGAPGRPPGRLSLRRREVRRPRPSLRRPDCRHKRTDRAGRPAISPAIATSAIASTVTRDSAGARAPRTRPMTRPCAYESYPYVLEVYIRPVLRMHTCVSTRAVPFPGC